MKRHKRYMTLMEVLVAMALTAALLSILMFFYRQATELNRLNDKAIQDSFQIRYIDNRLSKVFSYLIREKDPAWQFYFMTTKSFATDGIAKGDALIVAYNNETKR